MELLAYRRGSLANLAQGLFIGKRLVVHQEKLLHLQNAILWSRGYEAKNFSCSNKHRKMRLQFDSLLFLSKRIGMASIILHCELQNVPEGRSPRYIG
jgi:hypothetical protein